MKIILACIISLTFVLPNDAFENTQTENSKPKLLPTYKPISEEPNFLNNEELNYLLHYGFINGGYGSFTLKEKVIGGRKVFHGIGKGCTTGLADKVFRVLDIYESYFDVSTNIPIIAVSNISEGKYKSSNDIVFNNAEHKVRSTHAPELKVPENTLDMISALYYIRRIDFSKFKPGDVVSVITFFDKELFPFYIVFKGRENIQIGLGTFRCLRFVPIVEPGRLFKENDDMTFCLSDDENKIPIQIKFDMIVGSFKFDLISYKNLKYELTSLIKK